MTDDVPHRCWSRRFDVRSVGERSRDFGRRSRETLVLSAVVGGLTGVGVAGFESAVTRGFGGGQSPSAVGYRDRATHRADGRRARVAMGSARRARRQLPTNTSTHSTIPTIRSRCVRSWRAWSPASHVGQRRADGARRPVALPRRDRSAMRCSSVSLACSRRRTAGCCSWRVRRRASPRSSKRPRPAPCSRSKCRTRMTSRGTCSDPRSSAPLPATSRSSRSTAPHR